MADEKQTEEFVQKFGPKSSAHAEESDQELAHALSDLDLKIKPVPEDFVPGGYAASQETVDRIRPSGLEIPVDESILKKKEQHGKSHGHRQRRGSFAYWVHRHSKKIIALLVLLILVLIGVTAGLLYYSRNADPYDQKLLPNISIAGVNVGGMTRKEAVQAIQDTVGSSYSDNDMVIHLDEETLTLPAADTLALLNVENAVEAAYCIGREGTAEEQQQILRELQQQGKVISLLPYLGLDTGHIKAVLKNAVSDRNCSVTPSGYALEGQMPALAAEAFSESAPCQTLLLTVGAPGIQLDADSLYAAVLDAYNRREFHVYISAAVPPEAIDLDAIHAALTIAPVEAVQDPETLEVTPGSCGYTFSLEDAKAALAQATYGETVSIPMEYVMPETLNIAVEYPQKLASYFSPICDNENYKSNIALACQYLDGYIVEPGNVFSLKGVVPPQTKANGFQFAPVHADYCLSEVRGGGLDQIASTLHVAAICAEMTILQRNTAHHACEYVLRGTEISVNGTSQDFRFRNTWDTPVQIRAKLTDDQLVISIYGQEETDYFCRVESESLSTLGFKNMQVKKEAGEGYNDQDVVRNGINGGAVQVYRVYVDRETNQEIKRVKELYVYLQPVDRLVAVVKP